MNAVPYVPDAGHRDEETEPDSDLPTGDNAHE